MAATSRRRRIHPAIRDKVASSTHDIVKEAGSGGPPTPSSSSAAAEPNPKHARKILDLHNIPYKYHRVRQLSLAVAPAQRAKAWTGWPTSMVVVNGTLIGGPPTSRACSEGELAKLLA